MTNKAYEHEVEVKELIEGSIGLACDIELGNPKRKDFDSSAGDPQKEIEIDFLIPFRNICIVGEHTSLKDRKAVKNHLQKLNRKLEFLQGISNKDRFSPFQITESRRSAYKDIETLRGLFVYSNPAHDHPIEDLYPKTIVSMNLREWEQVKHHAECLSKEARYHFLDAVGIPLAEIVAHRAAGRAAEQLTLKNGEYLNLGKRTLAEGFPEAEIFVFALDPTNLLPLARVFRKDSLPALIDPNNPDPSPKYQRVLIKKKLDDLRRIISSMGESFVFPTAVLAVLSSDSEVDQRHRLVLPKEFGTLEIIDGQHRLFAYASEKLSGAICDNSRVIVVGVRFDKLAAENGSKWAARMFIDINTKQTRVQRDLQMIIAYETGEQTPEPLAAGMLLKANDSGPLQNGFYVGATSPSNGIRITTIVTKLKPLFDLKKIRTEPLGQRKKRLTLLGGDETILEEGNEAMFVDAMADCYGKFFEKVMKKFPNDWKLPDESSLRSAKYFTALTDRLKRFIEKGSTWVQVDSWLERVKKRSLNKSSKPFRSRGIAFGCYKVPSRRNAIKDIIDHLK